jgi:hypothetical protein
VDVEDRSIRYLDFHLERTFKKFSLDRYVLKVDWFDEGDIRAAVYVSKPQSELTQDDISDYESGKGIVDLILLCPIFNPDNEYV